MSLKQEFVDWKKNPITKKVFDSLKEIEQSMTESLVTSAGVDPSQDRYFSGYIAALRDVYLINIDEDTND
jgi:phage baseplate assembly protein W